MFSELFQWDIVQKIFLNTLLVSIPEELYLVLFTLILMGEFDYWKEKECVKMFDRWDYIRVLVPTLVAAICSNVFRYAGVNSALNTLLVLLILFLCIVFTGNIWGDASALKWTGKAFLFLLLGFISLGIAKLIYAPIILYATGITVKEINNNILLNFFISLPSRLLEYSLLIFFIIRKRSFLQGKIFKVIFKSKILSLISAITLLINASFLILITKLVVFDRALSHSSDFLQYSLIIGTLVFPIFNISSLIWSVYYVKNQHLAQQKKVSDEIQSLRKDLEQLKNSDNSLEHKNLKWELTSAENKLMSISDNLSKY